MGFEFINPAIGKLACQEEGIGKLANIEEVCKFLLPQKKINVLITAGGTVEKIDDVRYLTNISSGKQALEIANTFMGCNVTIIQAKTDVEFPLWCNIIKVNSANEMLNEAMKYIHNTDVFFSVAAVTDFTFNKVIGKIKKTEMHNLKLTQNTDILKTIAHLKK